MAVFKPTGTTEVLIKAVRPHIKGGKLLDLACGCGIVGKSLKDLAAVYASDISQEAVDSIKDPDITVKCGNLFEPWDDKFDYIVDDVSGVSEKVAKVSPWFDEVPCDSGIDGANLVAKVLEQAPRYLNSDGKIFFPVLSFSNAEKILKIAQKNFNIELLSHTEFPLPKDMYRHIELLKKLKQEGHITFREKFRMILWFTDIYKGTL